MQVITKRGEPNRVKLTKAEATRLQDAIYLLRKLATVTDRDDLMGPATVIRSVVELYAPEWLEDENGVPAKHQPKPVVAAECSCEAAVEVSVEVVTEEPFGEPSK